MALKATIEAILSHISTIQVATPDGVTVALHTRVWNNQVEYMKSGELQAVPMPACFVEWLFGQGGNMGQNYNGNDITLRIHVVHQHYNTEGSFEQDLVIFDLRDLVVALLNRWKCIHLSPLLKINEEQDFTHDNVYHYIIDFTSHFVGSIDDAISAPLIVSVPPLTLTVNMSVLQITSTPTFTTAAICAQSVTTFNVQYEFNTKMYFQNGTEIKIEYTNSLGTIQSITSTGDGYIFDEDTLTITITNINLISETFIFAFEFINPSCKDEIEFTTNIDTITDYTAPAIVGLQTIASQTYTPPA